MQSEESEFPEESRQCTSEESKSVILHLQALQLKDRGPGSGEGVAKEQALRSHADKHPLRGQSQAGSGARPHDNLGSLGLVQSAKKDNLICPIN